MGSPIGALDSEGVEASLTGDSTEPQLAPERRSTPVPLAQRRNAARARRSTLPSPIPALMAASMRGIAGQDPNADGSVEGVPVAAPGHKTSPHAGQEQDALRFDGELEYVVEIDRSKKNL